MPVSFFSLLLLFPLSMHASAARIFTTRIRKKILCNIKLASGHLPIRVVRNFTSVMTVMRILEKAFEKFFPYPAILRQTYDKREFKRGIYSNLPFRCISLIDASYVEFSIDILHHRDHSLNYSRCSYIVLVRRSNI